MSDTETDGKSVSDQTKIVTDAVHAPNFFVRYAIAAFHDHSPFEGMAKVDQVIDIFISSIPYRGRPDHKVDFGGFEPGRHRVDQRELREPLAICVENDLGIIHLIIIGIEDAAYEAAGMLFWIRVAIRSAKRLSQVDSNLPRRI